MVVFNKLSVPKQVPWNAPIAGYAENRKFEDVLDQVYQNHVSVSNISQNLSFHFSIYITSITKGQDLGYDLFYVYY